MNELDLLAFIGLFKEACHQCFGHALDKPLSEPESRYLSHDIEDKTGLVIGWKSIKNYAAFLLQPAPDKSVNPSVATLDTLARYVAHALAITEIQRKKQVAPYSYWYIYRDQYRDQHAKIEPATEPPRNWLFPMAGFLLLSLFVIAYFCFKGSITTHIAEDFHSVTENDLHEQGWELQSKDVIYWNKRGEKPGQLTLFTLQGDNWPKTGQTPVIHNLLLQKTPDDCFSTEVQFSDFMPTENWQQAGLLLIEDTAFVGKSIRLSLAYNDFFGGYTKPGEIIIQAIASYGKAYSNLEEIVHYPLFTLNGKEENQIIANNLKSAAVRIEKQGRTFRFLYAASPTENFSFKELATYDFDMTPKFVGIFALKGFVDSARVMPVGVKFFRLENMACE